MEKSIIYDLLENEILPKWKETIEKAEGETWFFTREREALKELEAQLDEKSKKFLTEYSLTVENRTDYLYYNMNIKILNLPIKIGMELQRAFAEDE